MHLPYSKSNHRSGRFEHVHASSREKLGWSYNFHNVRETRISKTRMSKTWIFMLDNWNGLVRRCLVKVVIGKTFYRSYVTSMTNSLSIDRAESITNLDRQRHFATNDREKSSLIKKRERKKKKRIFLDSLQRQFEYFASVLRTLGWSSLQLAT